MLPDDTKEQCQSQLDTAYKALLPTQVDGHFTTVVQGSEPAVAEKVEPYSDGLFWRAAIHWLIETNVVRMNFLLMSLLLNRTL